MILDDTTYPIVRMHTGQPVAVGGESAFAAFEHLLTVTTPFVLIGLGAGQCGESHGQREPVSLWMKHHRDAVHRFVKAMVQVEPQAANRFVARTHADTYEKFWGYPMLVVAGEDEAVVIARRRLAGAAADIVVDEFHLPTAG